MTKVITGWQKAGWGPGGWREVRGEEEVFDVERDPRTIL